MINRIEKPCENREVITLGRFKVFLFLIILQLSPKTYNIITTTSRFSRNDEIKNKLYIWWLPSNRLRSYTRILVLFSFLYTLPNFSVLDISLAYTLYYTNAGRPIRMTDISCSTHNAYDPTQHANLNKPYLTYT